MSKENQINGDKGMKGVIASCPSCGRTSAGITYDAQKDACYCECGWTNEELSYMETQIEEMARDMAEIAVQIRERTQPMRGPVEIERSKNLYFEVMKPYAEALCNEGYRKQRKGEWIKADCAEKDGDANCSICNHWDWSDSKYCSNCGAKMMNGGNNE